MAKSKVLNTKHIERLDQDGKILYRGNTDFIKPSFFREPPTRIFIQNNDTMKMSEWYLDLNRWDDEIKLLPRYRWKEFNGQLLYIYRPTAKYVAKFPELEGAEFHVFKGQYYMMKDFKAGKIHFNATTGVMQFKGDPEKLRRKKEKDRQKKLARKAKNIAKNEAQHQANIAKREAAAKRRMEGNKNE